MRIICAWCKTVMSPGQSTFDDLGAEYPPPVSHSACPSCTEKMLSEIASKKVA